MGLNLGGTKDDNFKVSKDYEDSLDVVTKKYNGIYYTPKIIVEYIIKNTLKKHDIVNNPYPKVLDISCGCGNFLLEAYDILYDLIEDNIYDLKDKYGSDYWNNDNIHNHIISNCIYGADIDKKAIEILKEAFIKKYEGYQIEKFNLYNCDSLKKKWNEKFDYIIGNPPYIGHKKLDKEYKKFLLKKYEKVYKDKSDLYFCFYQKIVELLNENGVSSIITPRYFLESPSGKQLREYIINSIQIDEIIDFLGCTIFKNIGICSCIVTLTNMKIDNTIKIYKIKDENLKIDNTLDLDILIQSDKFERFSINQKDLLKKWLIVNESDKLFVENIEDKCNYILENIATSFQGIITGCDKAFIINEDYENMESINKSLLKPWVKNKSINKYIVKRSVKKILYSNDIEIEKNYPFEINEIIGIHKEKLIKRRECQKNTRKWYELQWGREKYLFEQKKIMYPYKCSENRFAIDYDNNFCSADVYSFFIKENYKNEFSYEYLVGVLNSSIYDRYFKINAKKISKNIYDYYPNKVMKLKIFKDENYKSIERLSSEIIKKLNSNKYTQTEIKNLQKNLDTLIKESLSL